MDLLAQRPLAIGHGRLLAAALTVAVPMAALVAAQPGATPPVSLSMHVPVPPSVVVMDGRNSLTYELHVENHGDAAVTLSSLQIDTTAPPVAVTLGDDALTRVLDPPPSAGSPRLVPPGGRRVIYVDLGMTDTLQGNPLRPRRVRHRITARVADAADAVIDDGEGLEINARMPVVLGPPVAGGPWVAVHHPDWERGHRRVFYTVDGRTRLPGRFTIDWVRIDEDGRTTHGDADLVANALGYGAEALAVADATIAATRDSMAEVTRVSERRKHPQDEAAGNFVSLDLGEGRFAVYEHLKPGSIRVRPGQRVRRGEVVAQLGFTGDSTGPHLHLHVGDAASPLGAEGLPFVFDRVDVLGRYPDIAAMGQTRWSTEGAGTRRNERPGPNVVVAFPGPRSPVPGPR
jgi:murein DD-endopeptidase